MIVGENRGAVVDNIKAAVGRGDFHAKVELGDPVLTEAESKAITDGFLRRRTSPVYKVKSFAARRIANTATRIINRDTEIVGVENLSGLRSGAIITSNHFGPLENTIIRYMVKQCGGKKLNTVSQVTNFAMPGFIGFIMNYADTIPLSEDPRYLARDFLSVIEEKINRNESVLIYPEQEMWFNYRKPRPLKRGAYHFAAKLGVPVISCFVEIRDLEEEDAQEFSKVRYRLHILGTLHPDEAKSVRESSEELCEKDYALKKAAYERIYGKPLDYDFDASDIAGWSGDSDE
ncbi:MAG: 1-acyl-sn-glycerol-3-phosphate acyltransferase [Clostridia bacterium]|nr:1-acyl-sn-glycerol-3-phosphate acyltransferase [Clostridia bacterium]